MRDAVVLLWIAAVVLVAASWCLADPTRQPVLEQGWAKEYLSGIDLPQIKRRLAEAEVNVEAQTAPAAIPAPGETLKLTLDSSIALALQHNLNLKIARLTRDAVQTEIPRRKARFHPTVGLSFSGSGETIDQPDGTTSASNDLNANAFVREDVPTGAQVTVSGGLSSNQQTGTVPRDRLFDNQLLVNVVQPLLRGGWVVVNTQPIENAVYDLRVQESRLRADVLRVTANTKGVYYRMLRAERIISVVQEAIRRDNTLIEASEALLQAGLVTKRDVFSARISLARDRARMVSAEADLESAKNNLLEVLGLPFTTPVALLEKDVSFEPVALEPERWIAIAKEQRPEVIELEERLAQSWLNVRVGKNNTLPQLDLFATYQRFQPEGALQDAFDLSGQAWSAGLTFSIPLGNVAAKSALARDKIEHKRLEQQLVQTKRLIEQEVRDVVISLRRNLESMKVFTVGVEQSKGLLEIARARFALGVATNLDITNAQEDLLQAETNLLSAIVDYNIGLAELEARIAGPL